MTHIGLAIREAVEKGGWQPPTAFLREYVYVKKNTRAKSYGANMTTSEAFLDTAFWQALGKATKWEVKRKGLHRGEDDDAWLDYWHRFIDHLAEGKDAESFFAELMHV